MTIVLGIDAGNTKTIAIVARADGKILGWGRSGCGDIYGTTPAAAFEAQASAAGDALTMAGVAQKDVQSVVLSAAGADWPEDFVTIRDGAIEHGLGPAPIVYNDAIGGLRAGSPDGTGVVIVCGTGTAIGARSNEGRIWHTSFWQGPQGGVELGRAAFQAVVRAELGLDPPTALTQAVLTYWRVLDVEAALHLFTAHGKPHPPIKPLSKLLMEVAAQGDATASKIVTWHGRALADYALVSARKVSIDADPFYLVLAGGVLRHSSTLMRDAIVARVREALPSVQPVHAVFEPAIGAAMLALEAVSIAITDDVTANLHDTAPHAVLFET